MIGVPVQLGFFILQSFDLKILLRLRLLQRRLLLRTATENPKARFVTTCALAAVCTYALAVVGQNSSTDPAVKKPATTKSSAAGHSATSSTKSTDKAHASRKRSSRKKSARVRGQQKIDSERAQAIQEALIREHYLSGEATGTWNQASEEAMRRYQADNGWQSKEVPDSRALIKLGLGPSKDHLLNPESAMTTAPDAPRSEPMPTTSHSAPPTAYPAPAASSGQTDSSRPQ
jgi:hypothetical protein